MIIVSLLGIRLVMILLLLGLLLGLLRVGLGAARIGLKARARESVHSATSHDKKK